MGNEEGGGAAMSAMKRYCRKIVEKVVTGKSKTPEKEKKKKDLGSSSPVLCDGLFRVPGRKTEATTGGGSVLNGEESLVLCHHHHHHIAAQSHFRMRQPGIFL
ncbi:hypothetical protein M569_07822 [Genlisea aurea]|uniref:Uncharacterized protein n=1 Tax=Genlisea aurea TaxID=192259 RepID=S8E3W0_9LAMI|nr:hypothetical protein M569_07822 [Genlisea aurea]